MESPGWVSKKFFITLIIIIISAVLVWFDKLSGAEWVSLASMTSGFYFAGNVGASYTYHNRKDAVSVESEGAVI